MLKNYGEKWKERKKNIQQIILEALFLCLTNNIKMAGSTHISTVFLSVSRKKKGLLKRGKENRIKMKHTHTHTHTHTEERKKTLKKNK